MGHVDSTHTMYVNMLRLWYTCTAVYVYSTHTMYLQYATDYKDEP